MPIIPHEPYKSSSLETRSIFESLSWVVHAHKFRINPSELSILEVSSIIEVLEFQVLSFIYGYWKPCIESYKSIIQRELYFKKSFTNV